MPEPIKTDDLAPTFEVDVKGKVYAYDLYELFGKVRNIDLDPTEDGGEVNGKPVLSFEAQMERVREAFGFPTKASGEPTVTDGLARCLVVKVLVAVTANDQTLKNELRPTPN